MDGSTTLCDASMIEFAPLGSRERVGTYRQVDRHRWEEVGVDGRSVFHFRETHRDHWSVHLVDPSRGIRLRLDAHNKIVHLRNEGEPWHDQYAITSVSSKPTGWLTNWVEFTSGGAPGGTFKQVAGDRWTEFGADGKATFTYDEQRRDDWSVYLLDPLRNVRIQLDMHREIVRYAEGDAAPRDQYEITRASTRLTAWLVNVVEFRGGGSEVVGTLRQTGDREWMEHSVEQHRDIYVFDEERRDDWTVYLRDRSRDVSLRLDLHRRVVRYAEGQTPFRDQYEIAHVDTRPVPGHVDGRTVTWVAYGTDAGEVRGHVRQVSDRVWHQVDAATGGQLVACDEIDRDRWSVYLRERARGARIQLDLHLGVVDERGGIGGERRSRLIESRRMIDGLLVNSVDVGSGLTRTGRFRQTGWTAWVEDRVDGGSAVVLYDEVSRSEAAVGLSERSTGRTVQIDLAAMQVTVEDPSGRSATEIVRARRGAELWRQPHRITSRSSLTEDFTPHPGEAPTPTPVYRTSVSFSPLTTHVDVWASADVTVEIDGTRHDISTVTSARVAPSRLDKISISIAAEGLTCPAIYLRTNLMTAAEEHVIHPDVEVHRRLANLDDGALWAARHELGIRGDLDEAAVGNVQRALVNVARTAQYSYVPTTHGVHHDRALHPANMEHAHFSLDLVDGASYQPMTREQVEAALRGARPLDGAGQNLLTDLIDDAVKADRVLVYTWNQAGQDLIDAGAKGTRIMEDAGLRAWNDVVHGDAPAAVDDLLSGGEHAGSVLTKGALDAFGDAVSGAGQLLGIGFEAAGQVLNWTIHHTGEFGRALGVLFGGAGVAEGKAMRWMLDRVGWEDVLDTHDTIAHLLDGGLARLEAGLGRAQADVDRFMTELADAFRTGAEQVIDQFDPDGLSPRPASQPGQSSAVGQLEWLLGKIVGPGGGGSDDDNFSIEHAAAGSPLAAFSDVVSDLGRAESDLSSAFADAATRFAAVFSDPNAAPEHLLGAVLELGKGIILAGVDILQALLDALFDIAELAVAGLRTALNHPIDIPFVTGFYKGLTGDRDLTILNLVALVVAIPTTMMYEAMMGHPPPAVPAGQSTGGGGRTPVELRLTPLPGSEVLAGFIYGSCHLALGVLSSLDDVSSTVSDAIDDAFIRTGFTTMDAPSVPPSSFDVLLALLGIAVEGVAQVVGAPCAPGTVWTVPPDNARYDVLEAPTYWSHSTWYLQWFGFGWSLLTKVGTGVAKKQGVSIYRMQVAGDIVKSVNVVYGLLHFAFMLVLNTADVDKHDALVPLFGDGAADPSEQRVKDALASKRPDPTAAVHVEELRNYATWSRGLGGIRTKTFGNVMDTLPEIGDLGAFDPIAEATGGVSLVVDVVIFDFLANWAEGITYMARSAGNDLL